MLPFSLNDYFHVSTMEDDNSLYYLNILFIHIHQNIQHDDVELLVHCEDVSKEVCKESANCSRYLL